MKPSHAGAGPPSNGAQTPGIVAGRLAPERLAANFGDIAPALDAHEALVAADRCYFCYDAPCIAACPTSIDIPLFIRQIATGGPEAAARTILTQNILGGMCARVCPTETLCEEACVREAAEGRPVEIGRLQRYATDAVMARAGHPFSRAAPTGKRVEAEYVYIMEFEGAKIRHMTKVWNDGFSMQQLGWVLKGAPMGGSASSANAT